MAAVLFSPHLPRSSAAMWKHATCALCLLAATPAAARPARNGHHPARHAVTAAKPLDLATIARQGDEGGQTEKRPAGHASPALDAMIRRHAAEQGVPAALVHRVILRESRYNPRAHNKAHWGLMQIRHDTARSMGYRGPASGLLDPDTNLTYAVPYLANAYMVAGGNQDRAISLYARGFYYEAKRKKLLGRMHTAHSARPAGAATGTTD